jgi:hypothetical protein
MAGSSRRTLSAAAGAGCAGEGAGAGAVEQAAVNNNSGAAKTDIPAFINILSS